MIYKIKFLRRNSNLIIYIILIIFNIYLLVLNINSKVTIARLRKMYATSSTTFNRHKMLEKIVIKNELLKKHKLNLVVIWGENGCRPCKQKVAAELDNYRKNFSERFKFVIVGNHLVETNLFDLEDYLTMNVKSISELFNVQYKINQPIILLTNNEGQVLLAHEIILDDTQEFKNFNKKIVEILKIFCN